MKSGTVKFGMLGVLVVCFVVLPAASARAEDRHDRDDHRGQFNRHDDHDRGRLSVFVAPSVPVVSQRWVPGHFETRTEQILVAPGRYETQIQNVLVQDGRWVEQMVPAVTETRRDFRGRLFTVVVAPPRLQRVWIAPVYESRTTQVWCPAQYDVRTVQVWVEGGYVAEVVPLRPAISIGAAFHW